MDLHRLKLSLSRLLPGQSGAEQHEALIAQLKLKEKEPIAMSLSEERLQILKMLEQGKITAEEAAKLLAALETGAEKEQGSAETAWPGRKKRRIRIAVTDVNSGKKKVNVNVPLRAVKAIKKVGTKFSPDLADLDLDDLIDSLETETEGKIVDVEDDDEGKRVEIFVE